MKGLLIKTPWIDRILDGQKTWEIRGSNTNIRGKIALIRSGSGTIIGNCELTDVIGPLSKEDVANNLDKCGFHSFDLNSWPYYKNTYAWVLKNAKAFEEPIPYKHPNGAVIWVKLDDIENTK